MIRIGIVLTIITFLALLVACVAAYLGEVHWLASHGL